MRRTDWLPLALAAAMRCAGVAARDWLRRHGRVAPWLLVALLLGSEARVVVDQGADRTIERDLGVLLRPALRPGETIATDMPRLCFFAGRQPPPPRPILPAEILTRAARPECRFVVLKRGRTSLETSNLARLGLEPMELPALLSGHPGASDILLFARPSTR